MAIVRTRPQKLFKTLTPFGPYSKGAKIQPTGVYREMLLRRGLIIEITDDDALAESGKTLEGTEDRMLRPRRSMSLRKPIAGGDA